MDNTRSPTRSVPNSICTVPSLSLAEAISESYSWEKPTLQPRLGLLNNMAKLNLDEQNITSIFGWSIVSLENQFQRDSAWKFISAWRQTFLAGPVALVQEVTVLNWSRVNLDWIQIRFL